MPPTPVYTASIDPGGPSFEAPADLPLLLAAEQSGIPGLQIHPSFIAGSIATHPTHSCST